MKRKFNVGMLLILTSSALAADSGVTRKVFDRMDVSAGHEAVIGSAELGPGAAIGRHSHHGTEFGAEGELELLIDGAPGQRLKAGSFYKIEAGKVHDARGIGGPVKAVATWIVEKGKPLSEPAK